MEERREEKTSKQRVRGGRREFPGQGAPRRIKWGDARGGSPRAAFARANFIERKLLDAESTSPVPLKRSVDLA